MLYFVIYFILEGGSGYIPPQEVQKTHMSCGLAGSVKGVSVDRPINPTKLIYPDPGFSSMHCETILNITSLISGKYHIATTIFSDGLGTPYIGHDPHTTDYFTINKELVTQPSKPSALIVKGQ